MATALDSIGAFVNRRHRLVTFGIPAAGILLAAVIGQLGGHTGIRIFCYIALPFMLVLLIGSLWHQSHKAPGDDS